MLVSIITVCLNAADTIADTINSVATQNHSHVEHIVIDGGSADNTVELVRQLGGRVTKMVSEPDEGIYHAMNKGLALAKGDLVGFLNADDLYCHESVVKTVVETVKEHNVDSCYGDLLYMDATLSKVVRHWKSSPYTKGLFCTGWHPPHPTFFVKRSVYEKYGGFNTDLKIAADYEIMLRFLERYKVSTFYIPEVLVKMRTGGTSNRSIKNIIQANLECYRAWKINKLPMSPAIVVKKPLSKAIQYLRPRA